tara:strand:- start:1345 stop:1917 length:573 start_codon:yes stop_codon:yes gene_type:complete
MDLSILNYLFLILFPFIVIYYFLLSSIINSDLKGIIYIIGLLFSLTSSYFIGNTIPIFNPLTNSESICNIINIKNITNNIPINQNLIGYTIAYLLFFAIANNTIMNNLYLLLSFGFILICDMVWNIRNSCFSYNQLLSSYIIGTLIGIIWAFIINSSNKKHLQYFTGVNDDTKCELPARQTFKCKKKKIN